MLIFYRFDNGVPYTICANDSAAAKGYIEGLAMAAQYLGSHVWVTCSLRDVRAPDDDGWLEARMWLEQQKLKAEPEQWEPVALR